MRFMPSPLSLCLQQKEAQVRSCFPVRRKGINFDIPISPVAKKFCGKGEKFGDETLGRRQIGI